MSFIWGPEGCMFKALQKYYYNHEIRNKSAGSKVYILNVTSGIYYYL